MHSCKYLTCKWPGQFTRILVCRQYEDVKSGTQCQRAERGVAEMLEGTFEFVCLPLYLVSAMGVPGEPGFTTCGVRSMRSLRRRLDARGVVEEEIALSAHPPRPGRTRLKSAGLGPWEGARKGQGCTARAPERSSAPLAGPCGPLGPGSQ